MSARPFDSTILADAAGALDFITNVLEASTEYSIIGKDLDGNILLWNEGARRTYGYDAGATGARSWSARRCAPWTGSRSRCSKTTATSSTMRAATRSRACAPPASTWAGRSTIFSAWRGWADARPGDRATFYVGVGP